MVFRKIKKPIIVMSGLAALLISTGIGAYAAELPTELVPVGEAIGISVKTDGVVVSELSEFKTSEGTVSPAKNAGILPGDIIVRIDGQEVDSVESMAKILNDESIKSVSVVVMRSGEEHEMTVTPYHSDDGCYLGVWVRDGLTGIGTVTYYDPESGTYGALGHAIADSSTGTIIPLKEGKIAPAEITGVIEGKSGTPGQLGGTFSFDDAIGFIDDNSMVGIFGQITDCAEIGGDKIPVAAKSEIKTGKAKILCAADGSVNEYDIEITRIYPDADDGRNMMVKIIDDDLISVTGGIVQGMSGSPIIQNGKLIGAVTHVLINDPCKGYAVSIEEMLSEAFETEKDAA